MRHKSRFKSGALLAVLLGIISLIIGLTLAWLSGHGYIALEPDTGVITGIVLMCIWFLIASALLCADTSFMTPLKRQMQPKTPDKDVLTRVIVEATTDAEFFIYGRPDQTLREVLEDDWPFDGKLRKTDWYVVDERGNDVTDKKFNEFEGTVRIIFGQL